MHEEDNETVSSTNDLFKGSISSHVLKRNTACHQCRRRKLKCDAKRPCTTCVRSHSYAVARAPNGVRLPDQPRCTYDEDSQSKGKNDKPRNKYEKLENRIGELEGMLREMTLALEASQKLNAQPSTGTTEATGASEVPENVQVLSQDAHQLLGSLQSTSASNESNTSSSSRSSQSPPLPNLNWSVRGLTQITGSAAETMTALRSQWATEIMPNASGTGDYQYFLDQTINDSTHRPAEFVDSSLSTNDVVDHLHHLASHIPNLDPQWSMQMDTTLLTDTSMDYFETVRKGTLQVHPAPWPQQLPAPSITTHLAQVFFAFFVHAGRLFHGPTFMANLSAGPSSAQFPCSAVLHAICCVGSLYTSRITQTPVHTGPAFAYQVFTYPWRQSAPRADSFAEQQAKLAEVEIMKYVARGEKIVECLQAQNVLSWFYMSQARWCDAYLSSGKAVRLALPCRLNTGQPFLTGTPEIGVKIFSESSILPPSTTVIEDELRRNIFWITYAQERQQSVAVPFAICMDDLDIYQAFPVRGDQFELGTHIPGDQRQWSHGKNVLLNHPPSQTDSFVLYIKAFHVLSRVKLLNSRYRGRYYAGDPSAYSATNNTATGPHELDPRDSPAFKEIDHLVSSFRSSFPSHFKNPVQDEMLDPHLFSATTATHLAQLELHEPLANMIDPTCYSSSKTLLAARATLDLMYAISSTSYDVSLLDTLPIYGWYMAGRALVRFLKAAVDANRYDEIISLQAEIIFIHTMLGKASERILMAYTYRRRLYDVLRKTCGEQFVEPPSTESPRQGMYRSSSEAVQYDPGPTMVNLFPPNIQVATA